MVWYLLSMESTRVLHTTYTMDDILYIEQKFARDPSPFNVRFLDGKQMPLTHQEYESIKDFLYAMRREMK